MKTGIAVWTGIVTVFMGAAAMAEGFDRSMEVARFLPAITSGPHGAAAQAAKQIYGSGITDHALEAAIADRLAADDKDISSSREDKEFAVFMVRALASFGDRTAESDLKRLYANSHSSKVRSTCDDELKMVAWYGSLNAVMADNTGHAESEDPKVGGLLNLLKNNDYKYKHWAAERMYWDRVFDPVLMQSIAPQLQDFVAQNARVANDFQDDTLALFARLLGYSKNTQFSDVLKSVVAAPNISPKIRKYANNSLEILWRP